MPKPPRGPHLGSGPSHERLMLGGLAAALIRDERIRTTEARARRLRQVADRLITLGKAGSVHARRRALTLLEDRDVVHKLFSEVAPRYADRNGGYTRILKLGPRKGDAAPMALIELVEGAPVAGAAAPEETKKRRRLGRRRRKEREVPSAEAEETEESTKAEPQAGEASVESAEPQAGAEEPAAGEDAPAAEDPAGRAG